MPLDKRGRGRTNAHDQVELAFGKQGSKILNKCRF